MTRPSYLLRALFVLALIPVAAVASTGPVTPTFLLKWGGNVSSTAPGQFSTPSHIATDALGNVYVADQLNHRIQKFDPLGNFMAQWGTMGSGPGQFIQPFGIATDANGNVYVADNGNHRIEKFTSAGGFIAQWGGLGTGNGQLQGPLGVATDAAGNVYVADQVNHRIQKFTSAGTFVTKWGTLGAGDGQFNTPVAVATDAAGNVYVADNGNNRIEKFTSTGTYLTKWGTSGAGNGQFNSPIAIAVDAVGNVYVAEINNDRVQKFTSDGTYVTKWGTLGALDGQFNHTLGVAVDGAGNVYVSDYNNHRIQKFSGAGVALSEAAPSFALAWAVFGARCVATDAAGNVFAGYNSGGGTATVTKFSSTGSVLVTNGGTSDDVRDVAVDASGNVFISALNGWVQKFTSSLVNIPSWGSFGSGQFSDIQGVCADVGGNVYVADMGHDKIQKLNTAGAPVTSWGNYGPGNGQFEQVYDVASDAAGNVYTVEVNNSRVQKFSSTGAYITQWGSAGSGNGQFNSPKGIHVDAAGNVYVADSFNNRIQKFTGAGAFLSTWGASAGPGQLSGPTSVTTDAAGNIYVADNGNNRIVRFRSAPTIAYVSEVRNDQGRQVRLRVLRTSGDAPGSGVTIPRYDVFRRIDVLPAATASSGGEAPVRVDLAGWDQVGSFSAYGDAEYNVVVPTLVDATAASLEYSAFMVRAATDSPFTYFDSGVANGYSVDNLAPGMPSPFFAAYQGGATNLHWGPSVALDFETFRLYRGASADFVPAPGNLITSTPDTGYVDAGPAGRWYKLRAVDWNGNESPYAVVGPGQTVDAPVIPIAFGLDGTRPSPAVGGRVVVHFALSSSAPATVELIDVTGRRVQSRSVGELGAGRHAVDLSDGQRVAAGVWFIRLTQGEQMSVVRTVVLD